MSIDYDCYLAKKPLIKFQSIEGDGWQIAIHGPMRIEAEDILPEILDQIDERRWLLQINLEGQSNEKAFAKLESLLNTLIRKRDAHIYDPQEDCFYTQEGKTQVTRSKVKIKETRNITLKFFFNQETEFTESKRLQLFDLIEATIPKALPRRYGGYEPMEFKLTDQGKEHFLSAWHNDHMLLWRGTAPYQWVFHSFDAFKMHKNARTARIFVCSKLEFHISSKILNTKKALSDLLEFQKEASQLLDIFYSEIIYGGNIDSIAWRGLPNSAPITACLGEPYLSLWPEFKERADKIGSNLYARNYMNEQPVLPPAELIAPDIPDENPLNSAPPLAQTFPFEIPKPFKGIPDRYKR